MYVSWVRGLRPWAARVSARSFSKSDLLHVFLLVAGCDLEEARLTNVAAGGDHVSARTLRRVAALVQQADEADEAGQDGASQLISVFGRTIGRRETDGRA